MERCLHCGAALVDMTVHGGPRRLICPFGHDQMQPAEPIQAAEEPKGMFAKLRDIGRHLISR